MYHGFHPNPHIPGAADQVRRSNLQVTSFRFQTMNVARSCGDMPRSSHADRLLLQKAERHRWACKGFVAPSLNRRNDGYAENRVCQPAAQPVCVRRRADGANRRSISGSHDRERCGFPCAEYRSDRGEVGTDLKYPSETLGVRSCL